MFSAISDNTDILNRLIGDRFLISQGGPYQLMLSAHIISRYQVDTALVKLCGVGGKCNALPLTVSPLTASINCTLVDRGDRDLFFNILSA